MIASPAIDVARLIRIATFLLATLAGSLVFVSYAPRVDLAQQRLQDDVDALRSSEIAVREIPAMRASQDALAQRYDALFSQNAEAVFIGDLGRIVERRHVLLVSTTSTDAEPGDEAGRSSPMFRRARIRIELRGRYRDVLGAISDLSLGSEIVRVEAPSLRRHDDAVAAIVPLTMFEAAIER